MISSINLFVVLMYVAILPGMWPSERGPDLRFELHERPNFARRETPAPGGLPPGGLPPQPHSSPATRTWARGPLPVGGRGGCPHFSRYVLQLG